MPHHNKNNKSKIITFKIIIADFLDIHMQRCHIYHAVFEMNRSILPDISSDIGYFIFVDEAYL